MPDWLQRRREIAEGATEGQWFQWTRQGDVSSYSRDSLLLFHVDAREPTQDPNAPVEDMGNARNDCAFIVDRRNTDAEVQAVLEAVQRWADDGRNCQCLCGAKAINGEPLEHSCIDHDDSAGGILLALDALAAKYQDGSDE